jgi:hypothetical protein
LQVDPDGSKAASATELLGDLEQAHGNAAAAEQHYRTLLGRWPSLNGTSHLAELSLAELLTEQGDTEHLKEANTLLTACAARGPGIWAMPTQRSRFAPTRISCRANEERTRRAVDHLFGFSPPDGLCAA